MLRLLLPLGLIAGALLYFGGFLNSGYSRDVERPVQEVMTALEGLDVRKQPGSPGTDPSRSGGVTPDFRLEREPDKMIWMVMAGNKVATRMIATLEPIKDGAATRIHASVERGDAPEDVVSPAFRSEKITLGLFAAALESQVNRLTLGWGAPCDRLLEEFAQGGPAVANDRSTLGAAIGATSRDIMSISTFDTRLRSAGCDPVQKPKDGSSMTPHPVPETPSSRDEVRFEPGKPMVNPTVR